MCVLCMRETQEMRENGIIKREKIEQSRVSILLIRHKQVFVFIALSLLAEKRYYENTTHSNPNCEQGSGQSSNLSNDESGHQAEINQSNHIQAINSTQFFCVLMLLYHI